MADILELNDDVMHVIFFHAGNELYTFHQTQPANPPQDLQTFQVIPDWSREQRKYTTTINWLSATLACFDEQTGYVIPSSTDKTLLRNQWLLYRRALKTLSDVRATCRAWKKLLKPHWRGIYTTVEKFLPLLLQGRKHDPTRELTMPSTTQQKDLLSNKWFRLALMYVCKNGQKLAKRQITLKRYINNPDRARGLKSGTMYVVLSRLTQVTKLKRGREVDANDIVEHTLVEKTVDGHLYWRHKTIADVDAAVLRRRQILADTRDIKRRLLRKKFTQPSH